MDEHIEILSSLRLDLTLHLFHLIPHLFQVFFQFGGPGVRSEPGGLYHLTRAGYPVLIGGAPFIILILILVSPFLVARAFSTILARNGNLNLSPRTEEGYELLVLSSKFLHFSAISGTLLCQLLDVGDESLHLPI
jgi:glycerol-3-phosphate acyltransferase PlsY